MAEVIAGQPAPSFSLPLDDGTTFDLAGQRGRPVVVYFYPQDDTEGCTAEAIAFSRLLPEFRQAGAAVIGISPDSAKKHGKFKAKYGLAHPLGADERLDVTKAFGVWGEKTTFGRTYMGVERATFLIGADGRIVRVWRRVRVKGHAEAVLDAVQALAAPDK
jgi:thioredoxin-dependent peroxiredoxin